MQERQVVKGVVLKAVDTKESDRILTVLTAEGKISVSAKGARSKRSKYAAATQPFAYSEMVVSLKNGFFYLVEATTIELFTPMAADLERFSLAGYFSQLTEAVTFDGMETGEVLSLFLNALYALSYLQKEPALIKASFEWRLMAVAGFAPLVDGCVVCGEELPREPMLNIVDGTLRCKSCPKGGGLSMPLTAAGVLALRHVLYGEAGRLYAYEIPQKDLKLFGAAAEAYVLAQLERSFHTLDYYKKITTNRFELTKSYK